MNRRKQYAKRKSQRLCTYSLNCQNKPKPGGNQCALHSLIRLKDTQRYQKHRSENSLCIYGGCRKKIKDFVYCKQHRKIVNERNHIREAQLKVEVMSYYCKGIPHCQCLGCSVIFIGFLQMDHIKGGGNKHRSQSDYPLRGASLFIWIKRNSYPKDFQVLCANCNSPGGKGDREKCPLYGKKHV